MYQWVVLPRDLLLCLPARKGECMRSRRAAIFLAAVLTSTLAAAQAARHPFSFGDAAALRHAEAKAVSPDGKTILYEVTYGGAKGPDNHEWRIIPAAGGAARNLNLPDKFQPAGFTHDGSALYGIYWEPTLCTRTNCGAIPWISTPLCSRCQRCSSE